MEELLLASAGKPTDCMDNIDRAEHPADASQGMMAWEDHGLSHEHKRLGNVT